MSGVTEKGNNPCVASLNYASWMGSTQHFSVDPSQWKGVENLEALRQEKFGKSWLSYPITSVCIVTEQTDQPADRCWTNRKWEKNPTTAFGVTTARGPDKPFQVFASVDPNVTSQKIKEVAKCLDKGALDKSACAGMRRQEFLALRGFQELTAPGSR